MLKPLIKSAIVIGKVVNKEVKTLEVHIDPFEDYNRPDEWENDTRLDDLDWISRYEHEAKILEYRIKLTRSIFLNIFTALHPFRSVWTINTP